MIQRIQSIYVLVSAILIGTLMKLKFADMIVNNELHTFIARGIFKGDEMVFNGLAIFVFIPLIILLHVLVIFLYKKRILQIRILVFTIILLLGLFGLFYYYTLTVFDNVQVAYKIPIVFPVIAAILDFLAIRAIGKDEALIRSLDRIR